MLPAHERNPTGRGQVTARGYRRLTWNGRKQLEHRIVWEQHHGPILAGYDIHHRNGDKLDNRIANLECITKLAHRRLHAGYELRGSIWYKPCKCCGRMKPATRAHWYFSPEGNAVLQRCRPCHIRYVVECKQRRRRARPAAVTRSGIESAHKEQP